MYGVELLEDNAQACRDRLYNKVVSTYPKALTSSADYEAMLKNIRFILQKNIVCGNALDYTKADGKGIVFYEWKFINATEVKIRCFDFEVVAEQSKQMSLFSDTNEPVSIPEHNREFKPIHYLKLYTYAE